jgi:hypothetical protein
MHDKALVGKHEETRLLGRYGREDNIRKNLKKLDKVVLN